LADEFGCSRTTVKRYVAAGGWRPFARPRRAGKLDGLEAWLRERFHRHRGNADVVRQDLEREHGIAVSMPASSSPSIPRPPVVAGVSSSRAISPGSSGSRARRRGPRPKSRRHRRPICCAP
jgi:hypothetical protein